MLLRQAKDPIDRKFTAPPPPIVLVPEMTRHHREPLPAIQLEIGIDGTVGPPRGIGELEKTISMVGMIFPAELAEDLRIDILKLILEQEEEKENCECLDGEEVDFFGLGFGWREEKHDVNVRV